MFLFLGRLAPRPTNAGGVVGMASARRGLVSAPPATKKKFVVAVVCPPEAPALRGNLAEEHAGGDVDFVVGNTLAAFEGDPRAREARGLMFVATGGDPGLLRPLLETVATRVEWCHSLFAGVDLMAPFIRDCLVPRRGGIPLTNGRGAFSDSLGEYILAAALHFTKQVPRCIANRAAKKWDKFVMPTLAGTTMGFVGFGHIGQTAARIVKPLGVRVLALRRTGKAADGLADEVLAPDRKADILGRSDFVVSVLPGTPDTRDFFGPDEFRAMKPGAVFISCGRGTVVDEAALADALQAGRIAGAALDVFKVEPLPADSPLWACHNLLLTAHNADYTADYFRLGWAVWRRNFEAFRDKKPLVTPVSLEDGY